MKQKILKSIQKLNDIGDINHIYKGIQKIFQFYQSHSNRFILSQKRLKALKLNFQMYSYIFTHLANENILISWREVCCPYCDNIIYILKERKYQPEYVTCDNCHKKLHDNETYIENVFAFSKELKAFYNIIEYPIKIIKKKVISKI